MHKYYLVGMVLGTFRQTFVVGATGLHDALRMTRGVYLGSFESVDGARDAAKEWMLYEALRMTPGVHLGYFESVDGAIDAAKEWMLD